MAAPAATASVSLLQAVASEPADSPPPVGYRPVFAPSAMQRIAAGQRISGTGADPSAARALELAARLLVHQLAQDAHVVALASGRTTITRADVSLALLDGATYGFAIDAIPPSDIADMVPNYSLPLALPPR